MAANDYYNRDPSNQYLNNPHAVSDYSQNPYSSSSPYITPVASYDRPGISPAPSYHTQSPLDTPQHSFTDQIPLKQTSKIQTNPDRWQDHSSQYPPSPDDRTPTTPLEPKRRRRSKKKKGFFAGPIPWVTYTMTLVQITVFIVEIIKNSIITGSPIMIHPQFNPMIGPSTYVLINLGARFVPCMRTTPGVQGATEPIYWPCPNTTTSDATSSMNKCTLAELCGMSTLNYDNPNQWYRFIVPMFLHAGIIHIGFNMLLQMTMGREIEKIIGSIRYALVYFSSGIFGFVLGGNFAAPAIASTGASGCLFGILALVLLDLLYCWQERVSPIRDLMWILFDIIISFVLGLLPGLDNFSHIGGFLMGLAAGICILHSPKILRQRIGGLEPYRNVGSEPDVTMSGGLASTSAKPIPSHKTAKADVVATALPKSNSHKSTPFTRDQPLGFFKDRKPLWWAWWLIRAGALIGVLIGFVVLLSNFYKYRDTCGWCKYLSCLPINGWCDIGNLTLTTTNTTTSSKRDVLGTAAEMWMRSRRAGMR